MTATVSLASVLLCVAITVIIQRYITACSLQSQGDGSAAVPVLSTQWQCGTEVQSVDLEEIFA